MLPRKEILLFAVMVLAFVFITTSAFALTFNDLTSWVLNLFTSNTNNQASTGQVLSTSQTCGQLGGIDNGNFHSCRQIANSCAAGEIDKGPSSDCADCCLPASAPTCQSCGLYGVTTDGNIQANTNFNAYCQMSSCKLIGSSSQWCGGVTASVSSQQASESCTFPSSGWNANGATFNCNGVPGGDYIVTCTVLNNWGCWNSLKTCGENPISTTFHVSGTVLTINAKVSITNPNPNPHDQLQFTVTGFTPSKQLKNILICNATPPATACAPGPGNNLVDMAGTCAGCPITLDGNGNQPTQAQIFVGDNLGNGQRTLLIIDSSGIQAQASFTIGGTTSGGTSVPGTCSNSYNSAYGNQLCMSTATCSWQGTDSVQVGQPDANGNLPVTFTSQYANGVNVFVVYGKIVAVPSGSVPGYTGASGSSKDICGQLTDTNNCNPDLIAHIVDNGKIFDYCTNKQNGYFISASTTPISANSPARALMPLYLNGGSGGNGGTATITVVPNCGVNDPKCQANPTGAVTLYYQFYHDSGNGNGQSWCNPSAGSGDKCSSTGCNGQYTGCTGSGSISTNSILCIHNDLTSAAASNGYACWHYPWEVYPNLWQTLNIVPQGGTGTGTCGTANQACCSNGACATGLTCQNNVCQTTGVQPPPPPPPPPPITTTTTTATTPVTTSTTTTTPTTTPPLIINCNTCIVNSQCQCSIDSSSCNSGFFTAQNIQGNPLSAQIGNPIPPYQLSFYPNQTGSVNVTARCFDPFPRTRANSTTVPVLNQFLICPSSASVNIPTSCQVNNCNSGYIQAVENNALLAQSPFASNPFTLTFTAPSVGTVNVTAFCQNPSIPLTAATIPVVTGISPPPITQPPATGTFTGVNFQCSPKIGTQITCSFTYNNKFVNSLGQPQDVVVQFNFAANNGAVVQNVQGSPVTAGPGTNIAQITFDCSLYNAGTYTVSWKVYADESRTNPIAWSTNSPNPLPQASC